MLYFFSDDYYKILDVPRRSNTSEIKKAYRNLAKKLHPDKKAFNQDTERFQKIVDAYKVYFYWIIKIKTKSNSYINKVSNLSCIGCCALAGFFVLFGFISLFILHSIIEFLIVWSGPSLQHIYCKTDVLHIFILMYAIILAISLAHNFCEKNVMCSENGEITKGTWTFLSDT